MSVCWLSEQSHWEWQETVLTMGWSRAPLPAFSSERIWGPDWPVSRVNARVMTFSQQLTLMWLKVPKNPAISKLPTWGSKVSLANTQAREPHVPAGEELETARQWENRPTLLPLAGKFCQSHATETTQQKLRWIQTLRSINSIVF